MPGAGVVGPRRCDARLAGAGRARSCRCARSSPSRSSARASASMTGLRGVGALALLEPGVVGRADPGELGELLAAQAGHASRAVGRQAGRLRASAGPAGCAGRRRAHREMSVTSPSVTTPRGSPVPGARVVPAGDRRTGVWSAVRARATVDDGDGTRPSEPRRTGVRHDPPRPAHRPGGTSNGHHAPADNGRALAVLLTASFTLAVDFSILNVALPDDRRRRRVRPGPTCSGSPPRSRCARPGFTLLLRPGRRPLRAPPAVPARHRRCSASLQSRRRSRRHRRGCCSPPAWRRAWPPRP